MASPEMIRTSEQLRTERLLALDVNAKKFDGVDVVLGPSGIGSFVIRNVLDPDQIEIMQAEIFDPHCVGWRDNHDRYVNDRGLDIIENHDVFALKLSDGDQNVVASVPHMRALAANIQKLGRGLSGVFPNLRNWTADEMSLHRYDDPDIGLSFHRDNLRFTGLIAVLTLEGESDVVIRDETNTEHVLPMYPGDLNLTRATLLYDSFDGSGWPEPLCPDHAVVNLRTSHRTSFIVRDNIVPDFVIPGFKFDNWDAPHMPKGYLREHIWPNSHYAS